MQGIGVLIFWYRNQLYAIENRCGWMHQALAEDRGQAAEVWALS